MPRAAMWPDVSPLAPRCSRFATHLVKLDAVENVLECGVFSAKTEASVEPLRLPAVLMMDVCGRLEDIYCLVKPPIAR
jgi:hypothetical protein